MSEEQSVVSATLSEGILVAGTRQTRGGSEEVIRVSYVYHHCANLHLFFGTLADVKVKRLVHFFPTADSETIASILHACGNSEDSTVKRLLTAGFPLKKIPIPSS